MANNYDQYQTDAINVLKNAVVSAGAGSGKTSVLTERFSHLVKDLHYKVDEILTLTFTKKATVEMYGRIYQAIKDDPQAAQDFHKANIKTLDSYCSSVAKLGSHFYGISPDFAVDNDSVKKQMSVMAMEFMIDHKENEALKKISGTKDLSQIAEELFVTPLISLSTVSNPLDFESILEEQTAFIIEAWKKESSLWKDAVNVFSSAVNNFEGNKSSKAYEQYVKKLEEYMESYEDIPLTKEMVTNEDYLPLKKYEDLASLLASVKKPGNLKGSEEIADSIDKAREVFTNLCPIINFVYGYKTLREIFKLLSQFQTQVNDFKRSTGLLTFTDVSSLATSILRDHPDIRLIEKKRYRAIMIDEFQDNNALQRDMLFMLAEKIDRMEKGIPHVDELEKDKLFFVGDEKQSIYLFRGADVSVFRALSDSFPEGNMELKTNYRSHPALIAMFNSLFGGENYPENTKIESSAAFYTEKNTVSLVPPYEAIYHHVLYDKNKWDPLFENGSESFSPRTTIAVVESEKTSEEKGIIEAKWVADKIADLIENKGYKAGDIAILFRTYSKQPVFEKALLSKGIPYASEEITGIFNDGPVNDIMAWLRLCAYPYETLAYAKTLRSPLVNLSADETNAVLATRAKCYSPEGAASLSAKAKKKYEKGAELFEKLLVSSKTEALTTTIDRIWYEAGYRYETLWNQSVQMYGPLYDRLYEAARLAEENGMSVSDFCDSMNSYKDETERLKDMDIPLEENDGVKLMSIHKSKGLQFPVVFIISCSNRGKNDSNSSPVYASKKFGISINTPSYKSGENNNYFYEIARKENERLNSAELRRVAYVAATRAIDLLFISGSSTSGLSGDKDYSPDSEECPKTIFDVLSPAILHFNNNQESGNCPFVMETIEDRDDLYFSTSNGACKKDFFNKASHLYKEVPQIKKEKAVDPHISPSKLHPEYEAKEVTSGGDLPFSEINELVKSSHGFEYSDFGTIVHASIEASLKKEKLVLKNQWIVGLDGKTEKINTVLKAAETMRDAFLDSSLGKECLKADWKRMEYDFRCRIKDKILKGQMDLIFKSKDADGNERVTIVDYKTDSKMLSEEHVNQLASYQFAASELFALPRERIHCYIHYLRFAKAVDITKECLETDLEQVVENLS